MKFPKRVSAEIGPSSSEINSLYLFGNSVTTGSHIPALVSVAVPVDQQRSNVHVSFNQAGLSLLHNEYS